MASESESSAEGGNVRCVATCSSAMQKRLAARGLAVPCKEVKERKSHPTFSKTPLRRTSSLRGIPASIYDPDIKTKRQMPRRTSLGRCSPSRLEENASKPRAVRRSSNGGIYHRPGTERAGGSRRQVTRSRSLRGSFPSHAEEDESKTQVVCQSSNQLNKTERVGGSRPRVTRRRSIGGFERSSGSSHGLTPSSQQDSLIRRPGGKNTDSSRRVMRRPSLGGASGGRRNVRRRSMGNSSGGRRTARRRSMGSSSPGLSSTASGGSCRCILTRETNTPFGEQAVPTFDVFWCPSTLAENRNRPVSRGDSPMFGSTESSDLHASEVSPNSEYGNADFEDSPYYGYGNASPGSNDGTDFAGFHDSFDNGHGSTSSDSFFDSDEYE